MKLYTKVSYRKNGGVAMEDRQDQARGITNRIIFEVKGKARVGEAGIEKTQTAEATETAFQEQDLTELPHCQCGALLRTIEEIGAIDCRTKELLCLHCAAVKCARCMKSVGVESRINLLGKTYCKSCALKTALTVGGICIAILILIVFLIFG
jgi:hypothetical protein